MRFALAGLGLIALGAAAPANAADIRLPVKAAPPAYVQAYYNWTGFYVGAHVGYGWADFTQSLIGPLNATASPAGMMYGGQVGFNYQLGSWVFGIEAEYSGTDIKETTGVVGIASSEIKLNHMYNVSGRIGYAFDRTLLYGKFGGAWTKEEYNFTLLGGTATGSVNRSGWLVGAGIEYAFLGNWTAKLEYNYMDLGSKAVTLTTTGGLVVTPANVDLTVQTVKAGINYRFNWGRF
jgi:outer membrane immunogenic protein